MSPLPQQPIEPPPEPPQPTCERCAAPLTETELDGNELTCGIFYCEDCIEEDQDIKKRYGRHEH